MSQNTARSASCRAASSVSTSSGLSASAASLTANTARVSFHGFLLPETDASSHSADALASSTLAACSASISAITSRSEGFPSPISPPMRKMPNAEVAMNAARHATTTTAAADEPRPASAAAAARAWSAAMRAKRPALFAARRAAAFAPFAAALRDVQAARARDAACALARMASRARAFADRGVLGEGLNASRLGPQDAAQPLGVRRSPRSADGKVVRARSLGTLRRRIARATRAPFAVAAKPSCAVRSDSPRAAAQPPSASSPLRSRVCAGFAAFAVSPTRSAAGRAAFWRSAARSRVFTFLATTRSLMSLGKAASFLLRHSPGFVVMRR